MAAFRFGAVRDSYASRTGDDRNVGVVGFAFFAERGSLWTTDELARRESADPFPDRYAAPPPQCSDRRVAVSTAHCGTGCSARDRLAGEETACPARLDWLSCASRGGLRGTSSSALAVLVAAGGCHKTWRVETTRRRITLGATWTPAPRCRASSRWATWSCRAPCTCPTRSTSSRCRATGCASTSRSPQVGGDRRPVALAGLDRGRPGPPVPPGGVDRRGSSSR